MNKELEKQYNYYKSLNLKLNMSRGKPCKAQLDLTLDMMDVLNSKSNFINIDNIDCRNYGDIEGIRECKTLIKDILDIEDISNIIIYGNSSLNIMFDTISHSYTHGVCGSTPWCKLKDKVKWLCPTPGYDRHFSITEYFGIEMINIPLNSSGPDMDIIEEYIKDPLVKGIWCVPKYSNPTGITYSKEVVDRFARLSPKAKDFRIYWDNAYIVHDLYDDKKDNLIDIYRLAKKYNNEDIVYIFTSTSKISFPGSGISAIACSNNNKIDLLHHMSIQTIGHDKVNQLRHVLYFKDIDGINLSMKKHRDIIRPKFELVESILEKELSKYIKEDKVSFSKPLGGYFISLEVKGHAKQVIDICKDLGVTLTPYGSAYPYHIDPYNSNIRIAPSYPDIKELELATNILCLAIKIELEK